MYYSIFSTMSNVIPPNPLWNNLVAYYTGDNTPNDAKGTYNGTLINGATYGTGKINNGFILDGINDYVNIGDNLDIDLDSWSYNFWFKANTFGVANGFLTKSDTGNNWQRWWIIQEDGKLQLSIQSLNGDNTSRYLFKSTNSLTTGVWTMCSIVINRLGAVRLFLNAVEEVVISTNANGTVIPNDMTPMSNFNYNTGFPLVIGAFNVGGYPFDGIIDEIAIWKNKLLTSTEVTELYNSGSGKQYIP